MGKVLDEIYDGWKNYLFENEEIEIIAKERIEMCVDCDHFLKKIKVCNLCGCFMPAKARAPLADCPANIWLK